MRVCRAPWASARRLPTLRRLGAVCGADVRLDQLAGVGVDVLPVLECPFEHLSLDPTEEARGRVIRNETSRSFCSGSWVHRATQSGTSQEEPQGMLGVSAGTGRL